MLSNKNEKNFGGRCLSIFRGGTEQFSLNGRATVRWQWACAKPNGGAMLATATELAPRVVEVTSFSGADGKIFATSDFSVFSELHAFV